MKNIKRVFYKALLLLTSLFLFTMCGKEPSTDYSFNLILNDGWTLQSSALARDSGVKISSLGFDASSWYKTGIPSTVMAAMISNGEYPDIFMGDNIDRVDTARFRCSWWYRKEFNIDNTWGNSTLVFQGINYRANIWVNGTQLASADTLFGGFRIFRIDITKVAVKGTNCVAVEVFHQRPDEPSIGFVDWAPMAPDRELGLWRPVLLVNSGKARLENTFVNPGLETKTLESADLVISTEAVNNTGSTINARVTGTIEDISFSKKIRLLPGERQAVIFNASEFPQLRIKNPRIWWTHDLGKPELYNLSLSIEAGGMKAFSEVTRFGIRKVEDYFNSHGYRGYKLNGKEILIKGGGWVDGMFLNDTEDKIRAQMEYVRHTHMNTIRLEGFWGNSEKFYDLADELGILLMAGWSCQWEWNGYLDKPEDEFMSIRTPEDIKLILDYTRDHISWLRNHPSIFVWVLGSDKLPRPELEAKYHQLFSKIDTSRPLLFSCKDQVSSISGKTGVKMRGPYDYVSPNYWYIDSINGGAFGFNTETGPGPQVPSLEVVKSMIPEDKLWPLNKMWNFHCGRNEFQTLDRYLTAFNKRYGKQANAEDFTFKSQASNLESMRAMYEAFAVNREKTTGIIQWMYNSAWPKLIWQFWDYNLLPNGAFYGARIGARQLNIVYNYGDNSVYVTNQTHEEKQKLEAKLEIYSINGTRLFDKTFSTSVLPDASNLVSILPTGIDYTRVFFLKLYLKDANQQLLADNIYWLSTKKDTPDFNKTEWFYTPLSDYADLTGLNYLQEAKIELQDTLTVKGDDCEMQVRIKNTGKPVAFLIELSIVGENSGKSVVPVLWDDNYISLVPGEEKSVKATFSRSSLKGDKPVLRYKGWNL